MILLAAAAAALGAPSSIYQRLDAAERDVPAQAGTIEAFVPRGWKLAGSARGHLNKGTAADAAIVASLPHQEGGAVGVLAVAEDCFTAPALVIVLLAQKDGSFRRAAVNRRLFPQNCELSLPSVQIRGRVLIVNHNWRDGWAVDTTHRFRFDGKQQLRLIGFDLERYSRSSDHRRVEDQRKLSHRASHRVRAKRESSDYAVTRRSVVARRSIRFEDAALIENEGEDAFVPSI